MSGHSDFVKNQACGSTMVIVEPCDVYIWLHRSVRVLRPAASSSASRTSRSTASTSISRELACDGLVRKVKTETDNREPGRSQWSSGEIPHEREEDGARPLG